MTIPVQWSPILPHLVVAGGGLLVMLVDAFVRTLRKDHLTALNTLVFLGAAVALVSVRPEPGPVLGGMLEISMYTRFFDLMLLGIGMVTTIFASAVYAKNGDFRPEFYPLVLFAVLGMMILVAASDLMTLFLGIETMSLSVYVLACGRRGDVRSSEAALKYLLLGSFASAFLLMGSALLYGFAGDTSYAAIAAAGESATGHAWLLPAGIGLLVVALAFKVAMVPFHMWTPDVYEGAPAYITGFMATAVKAAAFAALIRFVLLALPGLAEHWSGLLAVLAVLTMTAGNLMALVQSSVKRMLAYSSIAHAGYLLLGVMAMLENGPGAGASVPPGSVIEAAGSGMLFYLLGYSLMNLAAFGVIAQLGRDDGTEADQIDHYRGLSRRQPVAAAIVAVAMFSLAGIPGTVGFLGKFYVFEAVIRAELVPLAIWGVVNSLLSVYYYLRLVVVMFMSESEPEPFDGRNWETTMLAGVMAVLVLMLGILPAMLHRAATLAFGHLIG